MLNKKMAFMLVGILFSGMSLIGTASAQAMDDKNQTVNVRQISFKNNQVTMAGDLYMPAYFDKNKKYAAIVVAHPWGGVKEQTAGLYARKLVEQGFITLAYDASHYGESGGEPRFVENPADRVEDIRSAIDYLSNDPQIDANRIGALGICAGGGYAIHAAQTDLRIKAVAGVAIYDVGAASRDGLGSNAVLASEDRAKLLQDVGLQRTREARGETARIDKLLPKPDENSNSFLREAYEYYCTPRGQHPNATGNFRFTSNALLMDFFAFAQIETISPRPLLFIAGSKAETLYFSQRAYDKANEPKELFLIPGASHFDMYDKPQYVSPAVAKLTEFFGKNL